MSRCLIMAIGFDKRSCVFVRSVLSAEGRSSCPEGTSSFVCSKIKIFPSKKLWGKKKNIKLCDSWVSNFFIFFFVFKRKHRVQKGLYIKLVQQQVLDLLPALVFLLMCSIPLPSRNK